MLKRAAFKRARNGRYRLSADNRCTSTYMHLFALIFWWWVCSWWLCRCFCAVPYKGKLYVFGGESEKVNKKMKMRGKRELNRSALWSVCW